MSTIHYSDANGVYIGGFGDGAEPPAGAIERPAPDNANMVWENDAWVAPTIDPAVALAAERAAMVCSPMQGILTLGEVEWDKVLTYKATATWAEGVIIDSAKDWKRLSQNIAFFQYLLGYTDTQVDDLFRKAAIVEA